METRYFAFVWREYFWWGVYVPYAVPRQVLHKSRFWLIGALHGGREEEGKLPATPLVFRIVGVDCV